MKNKIVYIILGVMIFVFAFSVIISNKNLNDSTVYTSSTVLSNKKIGWGIKRAENHEQPDLGSVNKELLEQLKENDVKAYFFLTGYYVNKEADLVKRMIEEGYTVGN